MVIFKTLFKTLNKDASSFTITDEAISNNSIFEVYPSDDSVILTDVTVNGTTANITFDSAAEYNIPCAVFINNLIGAYEPESGLPDPVGHAGSILRVNNQFEPYWDEADASIIVYEDKTVKEELDSLNIETGSLDDRVTALEDAPPASSYVELTKEEYDALPDSKLTDGIQYFIKDWSSAGGSGYNISTTEVKTGNKFNNKDIYIKSYPYTGGIASGGTNIGSSVIDNLNDIEFIINSYFLRTNNSKAFSPIAAYVSGSNLSVRTMFNADASPYGVLVFEYTKVGD